MLTTILCTIYLVVAILLAFVINSEVDEVDYTPDYYLLAGLWPVALIYISIVAIVVGCYLMIDSGIGLLHKCSTKD